MNQRINLLFFLLCLNIQVLSQSGNYVVTEALEGDGVLSILNRYQLIDYPCNKEKFLELNKIKDGQGLIKGKSYFLPIETLVFNSRTIRSSIGIDDFKKALAIQHYNERMLDKDLRSDDFRVDKSLWVPHHFLHCYVEEIEVVTANGELPMAERAILTGGKGEYAIFGETYSKVPTISNKLKGQVFYLVSGHGGPDPGAVYKKNKKLYCEDEYAYDVILRLTRNLIAHGATAYVIIRDPNDGIRDASYLEHDTDELAWGDKEIPLNQKKRLKQRSDIINELYKKNKRAGVKKQSVVFIHVDSRKAKKQIDLFFYYRENDAASKELATKMHKTMADKYKKHRTTGHYDGTISSRDLYVLRETTLPAVFIELGNITNPLDQKRILPKENRQALANWLCEGLMR